MVHVFTYIINVFPSIIIFLYRYLRSDDNPSFIVTSQSKWVKNYGKSFSIIKYNCKYNYVFNLIPFRDQVPSSQGRSHCRALLGTGVMPESDHSDDPISLANSIPENILHEE